MACYNTEQKKTLVEFLQRNKDRAYTIEELAKELKTAYGENAPGKSTVYRLIPHLSDEGLVRRIPKENGRGFLYQTVEDERCRGHLHLRCINCGRLLHLDDSLSEELLIKVKEICSFTVNEEETLLLGNCLACKGGAKI